MFINDPASTKVARTKGSYELFKKQVKYYWVITRPEKEDEEVDVNKLIEEMTEEQAYALMVKANKFAGQLPEPDWSKKEGCWEAAKEMGVTDGQRPEAYVKRCEVAAMLVREKKGE